MIQEVYKDIYQIPVPLPENPLRELNAYLIRGDKDLLIDTGFNLDSCELALLQAFDQLGVRMDNLDIGLTHFHSDHAGLLSRLVKPGTTVYCGEIPRETLGMEKADGGWQERLDRLKIFGIMNIEEGWDPQKKPEFNLEWKKVRNFKVLKEGDPLQAGNYTFQCIETSGHFPGHICFYEPSAKVLFSGDHILDRITPNVACYNLENTSSLEQYLENLDKVKQMDVKLVLPGHRNIFTDCSRRIEEIKGHHQRRLAEVKEIVAKGAQTGVEIASQMKWKLSYSSWEEFPATQKYFALGEALAHLNYLVGQKVISVGKENGIYYFTM